MALSPLHVQPYAGAAEAAAAKACNPEADAEEAEVLAFLGGDGIGE